MENPISVVVSADSRYTIPLAVTLRSIVANLGADRELAVYVLDGGIEDADKQRVEDSLRDRKCTIQWLPIADTLSAWAKPMKHLSIAAYFRLVIPTMLPADLNKVIYLDCDLVIGHDLGQLWDVEIGDYYVLAVQDMLIPYVSCDGALSRYVELGLSPDAKFFNSGVLVINLKRWRDDAIQAKAIAYVETHSDTLNYGDQDVLNALFASNWGNLDSRWNQLVNALDNPSQAQDAFILHYSSPLKPWAYRGDIETDALFFKYLGQTEFSSQQFDLHFQRWKNSTIRSLKDQVKRLLKV